MYTKIEHIIVVNGVKSGGNPNARDLPARIKILVNRVFIFYLDMVSDDNTVIFFIYNPKWKFYKVQRYYSYRRETQVNEIR